MNVGGLDLSSLSLMYMRQQISVLFKLPTSADPCMRKIAEDDLQLEVKAKRKKFRPSGIVRDVMKEDPSRLQKALGTASRR